MIHKPTISKAIIKSSQKPPKEVEDRLLSVLNQKYHKDFVIEWELDSSIEEGFIMQVEGDMYDWSMEGRLRQLKEHIEKVPFTHHSRVISLIQDTANDWSPTFKKEEVGEVVTVGDGIATVSGLDHAQYGEILLFPSGIRGMVQELRKNYLGCILFGNDTSVSSGDMVHRTRKRAGIPVGEAFLGRVVDALGNPVDGQGKIKTAMYSPIEAPAPSIIDRQPVNQPLETGLMVIDAMFPIGRGQRELIIGDRQTGKTSIAIDAIINQKGKNVVCIYVAIGQKTSSVVQIAETLTKNYAMNYTIIVNAPAGESATMQYIAPYSGCALAEFFMHQGRDVLIVYDDLSKHAIAYRAISLLLERSPGREAYPGDVFYLHSRLLERAAHLSDEKGGGSITALPIIETQAGDVSAYIPTNVISITDGQIFLESSLFFSGQRPAVNVGLSVSRVGGDAQTKAMKKSAGSLRLDLAQYREMEVFTQFAGELDEATSNQLKYGEGLMHLLRQNIHEPYKQHEMVYILMIALNKMLIKIPKDELSSFVKRLLSHLDRQALDISRSIDKTGEISDKEKDTILSIAKEYIDNYKD